MHQNAIYMPSFIIVVYVWQILGRGVFLPPFPIREQPRKSPSWIGLKPLSKSMQNNKKVWDIANLNLINLL